MSIAAMKTVVDKGWKVVEKTSVKKNLAFELDKKKLPKSKLEMAEEI